MSTVGEDAFFETTSMPNATAGTSTNENIYYNLNAEITFNCVVVPIFGILGSVGTIITIMVLYRHGYKDTTNIILSSLAFCDFLYLFLTTVIKVGCPITRVDPVLGAVYQAYMQVYIFNISRYAVATSEMHIVAIATERIIMICFPFQVARWITPRRVTVILVVLYLFVFLLFWPFLFLRFKLVWAFNTNFNQTVQTVGLPDFYLENSVIIDFYNSPVVAIFFLPGICTYLVFSSCVIAYRLHKTSKKRRSLTSRSKMQLDRKSTRMLLCLCILTVCLFVPPLVMYMFSSYADPSILSLANIGFFFTVSDLFNVLYSSSNFILYIFMSKKFYRTVVSLFSISKCTQEPVAPIT